MKAPYVILGVWGIVAGWLFALKTVTAPDQGFVPDHRGTEASVYRERVTDDLLVLYDFTSTEGDLVKDRSGVGDAIDLRIRDMDGVKRTMGVLEVTGKVSIESDRAATKIIDAVRQSNEITVEAWVRPADSKQEGPARIVTISSDTSNRNMTLGQERDKYDARLRTTKTSRNGIPSVSTNGQTVKPDLVHLVFTRDRSGDARIYVNGEPKAHKKVAGELKNWDTRFKLALANEMTGDRAWKGSYYLIAVYSRGLSADEVKDNFVAGSDAGAVPTEEMLARHFESKIAPILSEHCLECHDSATNKGDLDLSRKTAAFKGGREGPSIVPGKAVDSLLWEVIESNEMPEKRPPLSREEKEAIADWINMGATWSLDVIDPADYIHGVVAGEPWVQRLTLWEYVETVRVALGVDVSKEANEILPPDIRADGFSNTAYNLGVDLKHVTGYARLAETIAKRVNVDAFVREFQMSREFTDENLRSVIRDIGKWLLRGPLEPNEVDRFEKVAAMVGRMGGTFDEAIRYMIEAMVQSPRFIYRVEQQRGGRLNDYELASRMSYIIWGGPPDRQLMQAADFGELSDAGKAAGHVRRMLADKRAVRRSLQFVYEWLDLGRLSNLQPNQKHFPSWNPQLATDMRNETMAYFVEVAWTRKQPLAHLMNTQITFATPQLAKHYGLKPVGIGRSQYDLRSVPSRGGLLTQGSLLTVGGDEASMVARGLFVMHDLLRGTVKDPPPGLNVAPVPSKAGLSKRRIAENRVADRNCGGCHAKFEPLAYALEKYDGIGGFSNVDEHGNKLREDGRILIPGESKPLAYDTTAELMDLLANSDRVAETLTWKLTQFALGRPLAASDRPLVSEVHQAAKEAGGTYQAVLTQIVLSDLVRNASAK